LPLLEHRFGMAVGVGFVLVAAMLIERSHLMAKVPGLVDITIAQTDGLVAAPAGVAFTELVSFVGPHHLAFGIVGKRELNTGSHGLEGCAKKKMELPLELFC
jgi:hypothetical protein